MQWTLGVVNFVFLWVFGVPISYYVVVVRGGGLDAAWTWFNAPYLCINICLIVAFLTKDWHELSEKIKVREGIVDPETELESPPRQNGSTYGAVDERKGLLNGALTSS
jgi:hypothetical protein